MERREEERGMDGVQSGEVVDEDGRVEGGVCWRGERSLEGGSERLLED